MKEWLKTAKIDHVLAILSILLIFSFLFYVAHKYVDAKEMIYGIVGALTASLGQIYQFFFGSSKSSQKKDEMIQQSIDNKTK